MKRKKSDMCKRRDGGGLSDIVSLLSESERKRYISYEKGILVFDIVLFSQENLGWQDVMDDCKKKEKERQNLYLLECQSFYKIGISKNVNRRVKQINKSIPFKIKVVGYIYLGKQARSAETYWHDHYKKYRVRGEWFSIPKNEIPDITLFMGANGGTVNIERVISVDQIDVPDDGLPEEIMRLSYGLTTALKKRMLEKLQIVDSSLVDLGMVRADRKEKLTGLYYKEAAVLE